MFSPLLQRFFIVKQQGSGAPTEIYDFVVGRVLIAYLVDYQEILSNLSLNY